MLSGNDLDEIVRRCAVAPKRVLPAGVAIPAAPQLSSMTRTTARRMHRSDQ